MKHDKVPMQTAAFCYKLEEIVYKRLGDGWTEERVLMSSTLLITTLMYKVIVQQYNEVSNVEH